MPRIRQKSVAVEKTNDNGATVGFEAELSPREAGLL